MSAGPNGNGRIEERLVVVRVEDAIEPKLTARTGASYESPPQTREQAMTLVGLLLGFAGDPDCEDQHWVAPIAGGRRVVTLAEEPRRGSPPNRSVGCHR
jgi:hypothetical protein